MATPDGMIELTPTESWDLMRECVVTRGGVGRIAVSIMNHPDIFPVNYAVLDGDPEQNPEQNPEQTGGPSVVFRTAEIDQSLGRFDVDSVPLFPWNAAPKHRLVRIQTSEISGRRFSVVPGTVSAAQI